MNITSLLITLIGIIIIVGLYLMSRLAQSKQPQIQQIKIPNLKNKDGSKFSSVVEDLPARDGSTPKPEPLQKVTITNNIENKSTTQEQKESKPQQIILFISSDNEDALDGNLVAKALQKNKLTLGEKDIYHYTLDKSSSKTSLFRIANGTAPWTLTKADLHNKKLAGLSIFMSLPAQKERKKAIKTLLLVSKKLSIDINGSLKNDKQQLLTEKDENKLIDL
jgi:FtsZ-interacting cell division protein ZipA